MAVADADNILRVLKNLKSEEEKAGNKQGNVYEINRDNKLNDLNIKI